MTEAREVLQGWGRTAASAATVRRPQTLPELTSALAAAPRRGAIARGLGRSYGDLAQNGGGLVLDMTAMDAIESFDAVTGRATVAGGCSLDRLLREIVPHGWFLPVTPGTRFVTVGGAIACDVHGKNHHRDGGFGAFVEALTLLTPAGELLELAPGSAELAATAGGLGLTGVVVRATLRLLRIPGRTLRVDVERTADLEQTLARLAETDGAYRYSVAWVDGRGPGRAVLMQGDHDEAEGRERSHRQLPVPRFASLDRVIRSRAFDLFNELYYRRARPGSGRLQSIDEFFYPLDALRDWNRLYGRGGLVQYQFVVPFGSEPLLRELHESLARAHPALTVLKRFGPEAGPLSFPLPGWTVAVDFPGAVPGLAALLDACDERVAEAGGRVYLAKDARLRPELVPQMYPRLGEWRETQARLDPLGRMQGDLARRLRLTR
jgi:decaprenylphospho-beta-D-ribofuranose 2-oxidase